MKKKKKLSRVSGGPKKWILRQRLSPLPASLKMPARERKREEERGERERIEVGGTGTETERERGREEKEEERRGGERGKNPLSLFLYLFFVLSSPPFESCPPSLSRISIRYPPPTSPLALALSLSRWRWLQTACDLLLEHRPRVLRKKEKEEEKSDGRSEDR